MIRKSRLAAPLALACLVLSPLYASSEDVPRFRLGFGLLADLIPEVVGEPLQNEHHNPYNGDGLQQTSNGLMVWRKADNWTAFTDGWRTWVNGPIGLQERVNWERFDWEAEAEVAGPAGDASGAPIPFAASEAADSIGQEPATPAAPAGATPVFAESSPATPLTPPGQASTVPSEMFAATPSAIPASVPEATAVPSPVASAYPTTTATRAATATRTPSPSPTATPIIGGVMSTEPAGDWVTSSYSSTHYYTTREDRSRWEDWSAGNRIWFASEAELLAAFPGRVRAQISPTSTPRPQPTAPATTGQPSLTPAPTVAPSATSAPTSVPGGIVSIDPAGEWVTSTSKSTKYYTTRDNSYWTTWAAGNRIWFATEAALLAAYPERTRR